MAFITIHKSGIGGEFLQVDSYFNGVAYNFSFGQAGGPMYNVFLQGEDAMRIREEFDAWEERDPDKPSRDIWTELVQPYI